MVLIHWKFNQNIFIPNFIPELGDLNCILNIDLETWDCLDQDARLWALPSKHYNPCDTIEIAI